ncbi:hypothetical protein AVEN_176020-1, partial [Araneus ventricosus]
IFQSFSIFLDIVHMAERSHPCTQCCDTFNSSHDMSNSGGIRSVHIRLNGVERFLVGSWVSTEDQTGSSNGPERTNGKWNVKTWCKILRFLQRKSWIFNGLEMVNREWGVPELYVTSWCFCRGRSWILSESEMFMMEMVCEELLGNPGFLLRENSWIFECLKNEFMKWIGLEDSVSKNSTGFLQRDSWIF